MAFEYEVLKEDAKEKYPEWEGAFPEGWYSDTERKMFIWGRPNVRHVSQLGEQQADWIFYFGLNKKVFEIIVTPGESSQNIHESPFIIIWKNIVTIKPDNEDKSDVVDLFKEALTAWGKGYQMNIHIPKYQVKFNF